MGETIGSYTRLQRWKQNPKGIYYGNICAFNIWFLCPASAPNSNQYCKIKRATMLITTADSAFVFLPTHVLLPFRERSFLLPTDYTIVISIKLDCLHFTSYEKKHSGTKKNEFTRILFLLFKELF